MHFDRVDKNEEFGKRPKNTKELLKWAMLWDKTKSFESLLEISIISDCVLCLHDAIYYGYYDHVFKIISMYPNILLSRLDGIDAVQLIIQQKPLPKLKNESFVYTWGKSNDYVLGVNNDRSNITPILQGTVTAFQMSKSHAICCTTDAVYVWGNGERLGIPNTSVIFQPTVNSKIPINNPMDEIVNCALGRDHSLLVRRDGQVWVFGNNSYGQCGVPLKISESNSGPLSPCISPKSPESKKYDCQVLPFLLKSAIKKEHIIGAAASKVHSILYTSTNVYTFGLNNGQLGYPSFSNTSCISWIPRMASISPHKHTVLSVSCTDEMSFFLVQFPNTIQVICITNFIQFKINNPYFNITSSLTNIKYTPLLFQIKSKFINHKKHAILGAICDQGHFYISIILRNSNASVQFIKVWHAVNTHQSISDFDFGVDGSVLLNTKSRICYHGIFRVSDTTTLYKHAHNYVSYSKVYKYHRIPNIVNATKVVCNNKGSFGYVGGRSDILVPVAATIPSHAYSRILSISNNAVCISLAISLDSSFKSPRLQVNNLVSDEGLLLFNSLVKHGYLLPNDKLATIPVLLDALFLCEYLQFSKHSDLLQSAIASSITIHNILVISKCDYIPFCDILVNHMISLVISNIHYFIELGTIFPKYIVDNIIINQKKPIPYKLATLNDLVFEELQRTLCVIKSPVDTIERLDSVYTASSLDTSPINVPHDLGIFEMEMVPGEILLPAPLTPHNAPRKKKLSQREMRENRKKLEPLNTGLGGGKSWEVSDSPLKSSPILTMDEIMMMAERENGFKKNGGRNIKNGNLKHGSWDVCTSPILSMEEIIMAEEMEMKEKNKQKKSLKYIEKEDLAEMEIKEFYIGNREKYSGIYIKTRRAD